MDYRLERGGIERLMVTWLATAAGLLLLAAPFAAEAQQVGKVPRVGVLAGSIQHPSPRTNAFLTGLRDFGYVAGQNVAVEWRATGGRAQWLPDLANQLVRLNVDVIVATDNPSIAAAQKATRTIPIVMVLATDPVGTGFVGSLARPGGNITGLSSQATELHSKALQLLKETLPNASRVAVLWNPSEPGRRVHAREAEVAARALGLHAQLVGASSPAELDSVFTAMARERPDAILVQPSQTNFTHRARIAELAAQRILPTMGWSMDTVEAGWLMSYGPNLISLYRRAAYYVDKVLRGAKPAELPVEQPTKFELVFNLKTAKALGLTIPPSLVLRADAIIQ
jgi:putative ABC transport system substrate-binding protein